MKSVSEKIKNLVTGSKKLYEMSLDFSELGVPVQRMCGYLHFLGKCRPSSTRG